MQYRTVKVKHRIIFVPDEELKRLLKSKLKFFKEGMLIKNLPVSVFRRRGGIKLMLVRHQKNRFFVLIDLIHAFHQITREMISEVFSDIADPKFDNCFVQFGGKEIIPIGFVTSNFIFELFMSRSIDGQLVAWQEKHQGIVTRYADNILCTWQKNTTEAFEDLRKIFKGLKIRMTPRRPKKWQEPIRFCGIIIPKQGSPRISKKKKKEILNQANKKSITSLKGAYAFLDQWK